MTIGHKPEPAIGNKLGRDQLMNESCMLTEPTPSKVNRYNNVLRDMQALDSRIYALLSTIQNAPICEPECAPEAVSVAHILNDLPEVFERQIQAMHAKLNELESVIL